MMHPIRTIRAFIGSLGPVEQAQVVASTSVVVSMITIISAIAATGQTFREMDFISILTIGLFGFTSVVFSLRYGRQMEEQRRYLSALNTIADAVSHSVNPAVVLESALVSATSLLGCPSGWAYLSRAGAPEIVAQRGTTIDFLESAGISPEQFLQWSAIPRVNQRIGGKNAESLPQTLADAGIRVWASIPLTSRGESAGVIVVAGERLAPGLRIQPDLFQAIGNQISAALTNAHLFEQLRQSREEYADLFENSPDMYLNIGPGRIILACNETGARILDGEKQDIIGHFCEEFFAPDRKDDVRRMLDRMLRNGEPLRNVEECMVSRSGRTFPVHLNSSLVTDSTGKTIRARVVARDITERKKMEQAILHAQKIDSVGNLAGGIAHDFNNLLTAVLGSATILKRKIGEEAGLGKYLDIIESSARRGSTLTRQLLTFARKAERQTSNIDVHALIRDSLTLFERNMSEKIKLEVCLSTEPLYISGDEGQIQQALLNLCANARDAMPDGGRLTVITDTIIADAHLTSEFLPVRPGPYLVLSVSDTGHGIPPAVRRRVFEPFFSTRDHGTGLGLSVVYGVVQSHGGFLTLDSSDLGTTVRLYFPLSVKPHAGEIHSQDKLPRGRESLLVIDDEVSVAEIARDMLTELGYTVYTETEAGAGVEFFRLRHSSIDAVLLDVNMPGMTGQEVFRALRKIDPHARIIIVTGYGRETVDRSSFDGPLDALIQKPFQYELLAGTVRQVLARQSENDPGLAPDRTGDTLKSGVRT
jgi:PAS domain S-box-containing protein